MPELWITPKEARGAIGLVSVALVVVSIAFFVRRCDKNMRYETALEIVKEADAEKGDVPLFEFDPNTVELPDLMKLGLTKSQAVSIIRYRKYGKVFRIKEDLFTCYGISDSVYYCLEPYIVIADTFRLKRRDEYAASRNYASHTRQARELLSISQFLVDTVGADYLVAIGALSVRQASVFVRWRDLSGIYNMDELRECYVVSDSIANMLAPYAIFTPPAAEELPQVVDINKADSAQLRSVYGIGEKSVVAIMDYRKLLGGFYSVDQLSELKMVSESNFEKIIKQISCDSCDISKIDVNFASAKTMKVHPYIANKALRRLLKIRELKGGWSTTREMIEDNIFSEEEASRVRPYLLFRDFKSPVVEDVEFR